jgi:hypothetical protein
MSEILLQYHRVHPTSWAYLASLLMITVYFKFSRVWSIRNVDLVGLITLAPALLLVHFGIENAADPNAGSIEHAGYIWLFSVSGLFMLRLLLDALMVRRPLLEPNLTVGGLTFLGLSLFVFLMANVITGTPEQADLRDAQRAARLHGRLASDAERSTLETHGPGFSLIYLLPHISTHSLLGDDGKQETAEANGSGQTGRAGDPLPPEPESAWLVHDITARVVAILSQLAIVLGITLVGLRHFDNIKTGIASATLYLLLPYTAMWTGSVTHALPGALVVWAVVFYRRPLLAGAMVGLAFGTIYYPVFLLPLWISFYWRRGAVRFLIGVAASLAILLTALAFTASDMAMFLENVRQLFGIRFPMSEGLSGVWQFWNPVFRIPILAAFIGLSASLVLWPAQKNLGTLIAYSAAVMLGTQFWHAHSGGLALAWYLPLLLLTIFRPNLEDRVALAVVK